MSAVPTLPEAARPSPRTTLPVPERGRLDERSRRAREEPMSVLALGTGLYEVDTGEATYLANVEAGRCTCPDHLFRDVRCKHLRRVAIEITGGRTPPPGQVAVACTDCDRRVFVDEDARGPVYCEEHQLAPGDAATDRETGARLTVVAVSPLRANHVRIPAADETVASYETNAGYDPDVPVVAAVYPHVRVARNGPIPESLRVYTFPRTRLRAIERSELPTANDEPGEPDDEPATSRGESTDRGGGSTGPDGVPAVPDGG